MQKHKVFTITFAKSINAHKRSLQNMNLFTSLPVAGRLVPTQWLTLQTRTSLKAVFPSLNFLRSTKPSATTKLFAEHETPLFAKVLFWLVYYLGFAIWLFKVSRTVNMSCLIIPGAVVFLFVNLIFNSLLYVNFCTCESKYCSSKFS